MKKELDRIIERKKEVLPEGVNILGPDSGLSSETSADWLTNLLCQMYVQHGITKNRDKLIADIKSGNCRPWFAVRDGDAIAAAALVKQSDGSVEVGRAVSFEKNVGGLLMLLAAADHWAATNEPLVAEVRVSDNFLGVPSSEATQVISIGHLGLSSHALVPAFNHGEPNRQEMFLFSSSKKIESGLPLFLPNDKNGIEFITQTGLAMAKGILSFQPEVRFGTEVLSFGWQIVQSEPFSVVLPSQHGVTLERVINESELFSSFTLIPLSTNPNNTGAMIECLNNNFIPCGVDRNLDQDGHLVILFGRLRTNTLVAPIRIISELFEIDLVEAINKINNKFR